MKEKTIQPANLNSLIANTKADKLIASIRADHPEFLASANIAPTVGLHKVAFCIQAFGVPAGKPIYAFTKRVSRKLTVVVDVRTGKVALFSAKQITLMAPVTGKFTIDGVVYAKKDTVNGCPRYAACGSTRVRRAEARAKLALDIAVFEALCGTLNDIWEDYFTEY